MAEIACTKKFDWKRTIFIIIGLVLMFLGGKIIPPWGPMTELGTAMFCAFIGLIVLITGTGDTIWPSCAALLSIIVWGFQTSVQAVANFVGTTVIVQMIAIFVICSGLRETGAGQVIARKLLSTRAIQGKPWLFSGVFLITFLIADIFLSTFGGILFSFAVLDSIRDALGYKKNDKYIQSMTVGLYLAAMMGASFLPFSGMVLGITNAFNAAMQTYNLGFSQAVYIICTIPVGIIFMIIYTLCMRFFFKCDVTPLKNLKIDQLSSFQDVSERFNARQIWFLVAFIFGIAYSFLLLLLPKDLSWYPWFSSISQCAWFILVIVILSIVKVGGKPLLDCEKHFKNGVLWGSVVTVGVFSMLGGALSSDDLGFKQWLIDIIGPMFTNMSWPLFVLLIVTVCAVVTNFFSNLATGIIVATLTAPFSAAYGASGINVSVIGTAIAFTSMFAYLTYAAAGPAPLLLGKEGIENKFIYSKSIIALPVYIVIATVIFSILGVIF